MNVSSRPSVLVAALQQAGYRDVRPFPRPADRWYEAIAPSGERVAVLRQSHDLWHVFYTSGTSSGSSPAAALRGTQADAFLRALPSDPARYCRMVLQAPRHLSLTYRGLAAAQSQCYGQKNPVELPLLLGLLALGAVGVAVAVSSTAAAAKPPPPRPAAPVCFPGGLPASMITNFTAGTPTAQDITALQGITLPCYKQLGGPMQQSLVAMANAYILAATTTPPTAPNNPAALKAAQTFRLLVISTPFNP